VLKQEKIGNQISGYKYIMRSLQIFCKGTQPARVARQRVSPFDEYKRAEQVKDDRKRNNT
jgi:hypothetical protein